MPCPIVHTFCCSYKMQLCLSQPNRLNSPNKFQISTTRILSCNMKQTLYHARTAGIKTGFIFDICYGFKCDAVDSIHTRTFKL